MAGSERKRRPWLEFDLVSNYSLVMASRYGPHRKNYNKPGHAHELTFSCFHSFQFLKAERACLWLAEAIASARVEHDFALWAFVFMPEHVHLIVWPRRPKYDISIIRQAIKEPVGRAAVAYLRFSAPDWLARIRVRKGERLRHYFWQPGGGYDRSITNGKTLLAMIDYLHLNPVRRHLVERAADYKWSSAAWYAGAGPAPIPIDPIPPELLADMGQ